MLGGAVPIEMALSEVGARHVEDILWGLHWIESQRSLALEVPSHVAQPWGRNVLLNPRHADFDRVRVAEIVDVGWDPRLF